MLPNYADNPSKYYDVLETLTPDQLKREWKQTTEEVYNNMLGCVPPIRMAGNAFMVGECMTYSKGGAIYDLFIGINRRYYRRPALLSSWNPAEYMKEIRELEKWIDL
jgi:hypothetical protein